jgi:hypothetical protein
MRECRTYGSVRGVGGNAHPYRDNTAVFGTGGTTRRGGSAPMFFLVDMEFWGDRIKPRAGRVSRWRDRLRN